MEYAGYSPIVSSKSKRLYSFSKGRRFGKISSESPNKFYLNQGQNLNKGSST